MQRGAEELQAAILLHIRRALTNAIKMISISMEHMSSSGDGLRYIRIWAERLVFWDGVPSPNKTLIVNTYC